MKLKEIDLYITEKCNLECTFCSIKASPTSKRELSLEEVENLVAFCKKNGVTDIHITGGEPTLHKHYKKIIEIIINHDIDARLITNGLLLTEEDLYDLKNIGLKNLMFSLDGLSQFHNSVRKPSSFESTSNIIKKALKLNFNVRVNSVAWKENLPDIPKLMEYLDKLGVEIYSVFLGSPVGRAKNLTNLSVVQAADWINFIKKLKQIYLNKHCSMKVVVEQGYIERINKTINYNDIRSCLSIMKNMDYLSIRANGNIYPCIFFSNEFEGIGNINNLDLFEQNNDLYKNTIYKSLLEPPEHCKKCKDVNSCNGGCRGFNHLEGKITKDLRCLGDDYIPICPLIKLDLINNDIAPCTDNLV